ncbi:hypothetical protein [Desulfosporosinus sp. BICA1-9]|uniref:hypothetical protein n=1 Tax=Desulfosporosinus sp. BICA1-9 TaxID=1531958 RepID=UPI00054C5E29|nr:hypothetical protein [Desulfosporosinus sp. BICA1-9]KJS50046.1 MAG: hypothetical protein VR66_05135 [Peptococcaceae bacterium BRH_c23]KJS86355.1 MAG: hypothetical protein JL57_16575 [Desulfosporosinus sp. BICA1-9]HBW38645.1 hypothetical protein [Desulfosporosinus sp.]
MKKIFSAILPSLLIFTFISIDHFMLGEDSLHLLLGIFLLFPIIFIIQGIVCSNSKNSMIVGFSLSSLAVMLPISIWYNVGDMIPVVIIYLLLGVISFVSSNIKRVFISKKLL